MKFTDMPYRRPDVESLRDMLRKSVASLEMADSFPKADAVFLEVDVATQHFETMYALTEIRHAIDTEDKFYSGEKDFFDEAVPELQEQLQEWSKALLASGFRKEFEAKYGRLLFLNTEISLKTFSPEIVGDLQEENALATEYDKLIASAQILFEGKKYTLSQLTPMMEDRDDKRRHKAWHAVGGFYMDNAETLDRIYDDMVRVRTRMAKKLGYSDFIQLGYYRMTRNCYDRNDVEHFREAVRKYLVPLAEDIYKRQAKRVGCDYPISFADINLKFRSGNPRPVGTAEDILARGRRFYRELSRETAEFIDFMFTNELMDVLSRKGKSGGGFCTELPDYKAPFIFANFNGTQGDVEVMTHEAGHAFASYIARDITPVELRTPPMESAEIHSMSMEFFAWPWTKGFFGGDADKYRYSHLAGALEFIPYGTMVDHFQHEMYLHPEFTPAQRHQTWRSLMAVYMPWVRLDDGVPFYGDGRHWQRQSHIYAVPFYYIDYCLAQTVALQFWALAQKNRKQAWDAYMRLVSKAGTQTFTELVQTAGLASPFGGEGLRTVCETAGKWLSEADMTGLE